MIVSSLGSPFAENTRRTDSPGSSVYGILNESDFNTTLTYNGYEGNSIDSSISLNYVTSEILEISSYDFRYGDSVSNKDVSCSIKYGITSNADSSTNLNYDEIYPKDSSVSAYFERGLPRDYDIDFNFVTNPLPSDSSTTLSWREATKKDLETRFGYGYSINEFLIGGPVRTGYVVEPAATIPEPEPWVPGEVIRVVNVVNIVTLPDRTPINFTSLTMSLDIDSFSWIVNFDVVDMQTLNLLKPVGNTVKEVEISINSETFTFFVGKTRTTKTARRGQAVVPVSTCTCWSPIKKLDEPFSKKRSFVEQSQATPEGLITNELSGSGFTFTWSTVTWTIPANFYSYINLTPLGAIKKLAFLVGAVIVPSDNSNSFEVKPRYPVSPWNWDTVTPAFTIYENSVFSIDAEYSPGEAADSIFVHGDEGGVGVKVVKAGTAGLVTLPTVIDKLFTDNVPATERGRIEIASKGNIERVPITTYVDAFAGIMRPLSIVEVVQTDGVRWRGMVTSVSLSVNRVGTEIVQSVVVERHHG